MLTKTEELCPSFLSQAREISIKFEQIFKLFAACHFVYDSADYLKDGKIDKLKEKNLTFVENMNTMIRSCLKSVPPFFFFCCRGRHHKFLQFIREKFPDMTITPKFHMLKEHVCPFLRKWYMGLGFYGERRIEGIHSQFNTQSQHFDHVKRKDMGLCQILVNHHIATSPELAGKAPKPKERNLKWKEND